MNGKKYSKILTIILVLIVISVIGLLGFLGYSFYKKYSVDKDASEFVDSFEGVATEDGPDSDTPSGDVDLTEVEEVGGTNSKKKKYKGYDVVGTIQIPKINLSYPILSEYSAKSLDTSVVAIYPKNPIMNVEGNVVIAGHNYRNGAFFSNNKKLAEGDKVYITDLDNNKVTYVIYRVFQASDTDTSFYNRDTDGKKEITLSTCTDDSKARVIVLARAE